MITPTKYAVLPFALALPACAVSDDVESGESGETVDSVVQESGGHHGYGHQHNHPRPVLGQMVAEWSNVSASPCFFFSGPKNIGMEFTLGEAASFRFGPGFTTKIGFGDGADFVGPIAIESPITLTRSPETCSSFGSDYQFTETLSGEWTNPSWFGFSFVGTYHYSECQVLEDGTCADDGCTIDADITLRPRVTTDVVDAPYEVTGDECVQYCQHFVDVLDAVGGCEDPFVPGYDDCVAGCAFNFGNPPDCDALAADLLACEAEIPVDAYVCFHDADGDHLGFPGDCFGAQMAWQGCLFAGEPTGACSL
jgi:hypothetical protein